LVQQSVGQPNQLNLLGQLIGEWMVGVAIKNANGQVASGCGEMSAVELEGLGVNSSFNMHVEGYDDYLENDLWSFDQLSGKIHLFAVTSQGQAHDHVGDWMDNQTLVLSWKGSYEEEALEENIVVKWVSKDQIEVKETDVSRGKEKVTVDYVFKRKETSPK
jgi:hypothetical protein